VSVFDPANCHRRVSILHGRPVSLHDGDVDAALPVDFPGLMPHGQISNHSNMIALITLTLKLGEVANEMYVFPPVSVRLD
jgi:hypothetical protein